MTDFKKEFANFISENNVVGVTAGVIIGISTKDVVLSCVQDIVVPLITILLIKLNGKIFTKYIKGKSSLNISSFISNFITWILILIITFFFLTFTFNKLLNVPPKEKK